MKSDEPVARPRKRKNREAEPAPASKKKLIAWCMVGGAIAAWSAIGLWFAFGGKNKTETASSAPPPAVQPSVPPSNPAPKDEPKPAPKADVPVPPIPAPTTQPPFSERFPTKEQDAKIRAALTLLGKNALPETDVPPNAFAYGQEDHRNRSSDEFDAVMNHGGRELGMRGPGWSLDLGNAFPKAAQAVAAKCPRTDFYLRFSSTVKPVPFASIRDMLGVEDAVTPGAIPISATETLKSAWHFYGWCGFGVMDGNVIGLKADCRKVIVDASAAPPPPMPPIASGKPSLDPPLHRVRHEDPIGGAAFAAGGTEFISWETSGRVFTFDAKTGAEKKRLTIPGADGLVRAAPLSPTRWLLETNERARIWDVKNAMLLPAVDSEDPVSDWHISTADGGYLLTSGRDVFNLRSRSKLRMLGKSEPATPLNPVPDLSGGALPTGHPRTVAAFSADGRRVLWARNRKMSLFEVSTGKELHAFEEAGYVNSIALSADGTRAITGEAISGGGGFGVAAADRPVRVWDLRTWKESTTRSRGPNEVPATNSRSIALSPDGKRALICWRDQRGGTALELLTLGDAAAGKLLDETDAPPASSSPPPSLTENFNLGGGNTSNVPTPRTIESAAFSPDGKFAISSGRYGKSGGEVRVWKLPEN